LSASFPANRRFLQKFYMVAYVTKAGLGPEPEFVLLCRSFFRWSRLVLRHNAYLQCLHCLFFRWRSWYCCAGRLASPSVTRPARPEPLLNLDKVFEDAKILVAVFMICIIIFFQNSHRKDDWVKKSSKSTEKQESRKIRHMQFSHIKTSNWRLSGKWVKNDPICRKSQKKVRKVGRKVTLSLYYVTGGGGRVLGVYYSWSQGGEGQKVAKIRSRGK